MGLRAPRGGGAPAATIIASVGCPMGCNFCTTSAFFGGKGKLVNFYERGAELFEVMSQIEAKLVERNGPSLYRLMRTMLQGWRRYHSDRDPLRT